MKYILSDYVVQALSEAVYDKLDDGTFAGKSLHVRAWSLLGRRCGSVKTNCNQHWRIGYWSA